MTMRGTMLVLALLGTTAAAPVYPPFGLDLTARDPATKPGDDFFQYANGAYLARTEFPADRPSATRRFEMTARTDDQLHILLDDAAKEATDAPATVSAKVGTFYAAFMDEAQAETVGAAALNPELFSIRVAADRSALAGLMGRSPMGLFPSLFGVYIDSDLKNPTDMRCIWGRAASACPTATIT